MFGNEPSIADLSLACELAGLELIQFPLDKKYPSIYKWLYGDMMKIEGFKKIYDIGRKQVFTLKQMLDNVEKDEGENGGKKVEAKM